ncbi:MAG: hypothetical protein JXB35_13250 [Anaerolineae bacterium]|nr:hypothetical protein [Anaerolineae bacterium]
MTVSRRSGHPHILWICGLIIVVVTACTAPAPPTLSPLPTATYYPMPTRLPTATPYPPAHFLEQMIEAWVRGDMATAKTAWEAAYQLDSKNARTLREGARLALLDGKPHTALKRAEAAVRADEEDAQSWLLLGVIQQRLGETAAAQNSLTQAVALDAALAEALFPARWQAARELGDSETLVKLSQAYLIAHPNDAYGLYYRSETLLAAGMPRAALELLTLGMDTTSPAVLWYTLGRAYLELKINSQAIIVLETAQRAYDRGDASMSLASGTPARDLNAALGQAYIGMRRCEEAVSILELLATPYPDLVPLLNEAKSCPTPMPTPTFVPWLMPSDQVKPFQP